MMDSREEVRDSLVRFVREHPRADMYHRLWGSCTQWEELPTLTRTFLAATPLSRRRYAEGKSLIKIVSAEQSFASEWTFADIGAEPFGVPSMRPMIYLRDPHETIEKGIWCHMNGMTRLLGEQNSAISLAAAAKFRIDSFIGDVESLENISSYLSTTFPLKSISLIGTAFDIERIRRCVYGASRTRLIVALPETGAFAETDLERYPECDPLSDTILEQTSNGVLLTRVRRLVTPIIRYRLPQIAELSDRGSLVF